jgi:hypothetical protein
MSAIVPVVLIAIVIIIMEIIHFIYLGFNPALSILIVFVITGLVVFAILNMEDGDKNDK